MSKSRSNRRFVEVTTRHMDHADEAVAEIDQARAADPVEVPAEVVAGLAAALAELTVDDLNALMSGAPVEYHGGVLGLIGVKVNLRFIKTGAGRLMLGPFRRRSAQIPVQVGELVLTARLNDAVADELGDSFDDPTVVELEELAATLEQSWSPRIVTAYLWSVAASDAPAAATVASVAAAR